MIWLFKIDVFWSNKPKVNEHYEFPKVNDIEFDIDLYDISLYMGTSSYFLLNDTNPGDIYILFNNRRVLVDKNTDYYNVISDYYTEISRDRKIKELLK